MPFRATAAAGDATQGITVGTGTGAVAPSDNKLGTQIAHGTGAGQLSYGGMGFGSVSTTATQTKLTMSRAFTNNSGSTITIQEIGLYACFMDNSNNLRIFCLIRDLVAGGQAVLNGSTVTATLTLALTA